jgi:hypothetical protein
MIVYTLSSSNSGVASRLARSQLLRAAASHASLALAEAFVRGMAHCLRKIKLIYLFELSESKKNVRIVLRVVERR